MGVSIHITPLYGSHTSSHAISHLLTIDNFNILLDVGWTAFFDEHHLDNLRQVAPKVNAVLLSHPDLSHLGALPYALRHLGLDAPVFSTLPVWRMGQMFMYNAYLSVSAQTPFSLFNLDDVDAAFELRDRFHLLKYQQRHLLNAHGVDKLVITPHAAGHMLGGAVWSIQKETETVLYAVHLNHRRERHLNPTTLSSFSRPSHLLISAARADSKTESSKSSALIEVIRSAIIQSGNVLIPVDTAGRVIELAVVLDDAWHNDSFLRSANLVIMHDLSSRTFEFARSMIEWMSDEVVKRFDVSRDNIFDMKHVKLLQSVKQLDSLSGPLVVLASSVSMEAGSSRHLFVKWCSRAPNCVVLVDRPEPNTLYASLHQHATRLQEAETSLPPLQIPVTLRRKEYLKGEELKKWRENERKRKAAEAEEKRKQEEEQRQKMELLAKIEEGEHAQRQTSSKDVAMTDADDEATGNESAPSEEADEKHVDEDVKIVEMMRRYDIRPKRANMECYPFKIAPMPFWDEYGQIIDTGCFMIGEDPGEGAPSRDSEERKPETTTDVDLLREEVPAEFVEENMTLDVRCAIRIVDYAGLCDGDSLKRLIKEVEPRHVTLLAGNEEETTHFKQYVVSQVFGSGRDRDSMYERADGCVVAPVDMETVDITSKTSVCHFSLQDKLIGSLRWETVNLSHIAFVDATVTEERDASGRQMLSSMDSDDTSAGMTDVTCREDSGFEGGKKVRAGDGGHETVMIGTVMLNQLLEKLSKAGLKAEFAGGALCVQNADSGAVVLVKKTAAQRIALEGAFSEEYVKIRDVLYEELIIPR